MTALFLMAAMALAQVQTPPQPPVFTPPPPAPAQPNAANPSQRIRIQRPDMPAANDVIVTADSQAYEGSMRHLRGHVVVDTIDRKLEADEVDYDEDTSIVEARGHVRFENYLEGDKIECDHGTYNYNDETGIF